MKKKQIFIGMMAALLLALGVNFSLASSSQAATKSVAGLTTSKPIKYNKQKQEVTVLTTVNGTYLTQPTRHLIVNVDGSNGNKSLLKTVATPKEFYQDLKKVGAKAGDNLTAESKAGSKVKGSDLAVYFIINGKRVKAEKAIQVNDKNVKNLDFKFGGNMATNNKMKTGCVICFDSCPVGIASGAKYGFKFGEHFTGKSSILPKDGTQIAVVVKVK